MSQTSSKKRSPSEMQSKKVKQFRFCDIRTFEDSDLVSQFGNDWESRLVIRMKKILEPEHQCMAMSKKLVKGSQPTYCRCSRRFHPDTVNSTGHKLCKIHAKMGENGEFKYKKLGLYTDTPPPLRKRANGPPCRSYVLRKNKDTNRSEIVQCGINTCGDSKFCTRCSKPWKTKDGSKREFKIGTKYNNKVPVYPEYKWQCYGSVDEPVSFLKEERERLSSKKTRKKKAEKKSIYDTATDDAACEAFFQEQYKLALNAHKEAMEKRNKRLSNKSSECDNDSSNTEEESLDNHNAESDEGNDSDLSADDE